METATKNTIKYLIFPLLLAVILVFYADARIKPDFLLHVDFLDIGQGDAIFIQTFQGNQVLIDGGPTNAILKEIGNRMPFWDRTVEMIVLTHAHADHVAGLVDVLKRYKVKKVVLPEVEFRSGVYDEFISSLDKEGAEKIFAKAGQRIWLDQATVFDVYYPAGGKVAGASLHDGFGTSSSELNDTSIVGKLSFGKNKILFTGDAGINIEKILLPAFNLDSDLLKVGHHGSRHSTSDEFLQEVTPQAAVIQVGKNNYGHPTSEVLENLSQFHSQIYRTDRDGSISFISDGVNLYRK